MTDAGRTSCARRTVGFVFQKFNLLPNLTARDNIAVARYIAGKDPKPDPKFEEVLRLLGIAHRLDHKPTALSGGEQQRVAIARAIVNHPAILLADEPTGNLDTENSNAVLEILRDLNQRLGQTILMITHNPEAAAYGHRTVHMRDGRIVGEPEYREALYACRASSSCVLSATAAGPGAPGRASRSRPSSSRRRTASGRESRGS